MASLEQVKKHGLQTIEYPKSYTLQWADQKGVKISMQVMVNFAVSTMMRFCLMPGLTCREALVV